MATNLTDALFRIEPTKGLVEYIQATKPYHTKILDVLVEYVYGEQINVTIDDRLSWSMELTRPDVDLTYTCGYGFIWDPLYTTATPDGPLTPQPIVEAVNEGYTVTSVDVTLGTFTVEGDVTAYLPNVAQVEIIHSELNNGTYTIDTLIPPVYNVVDETTTIAVIETIPSSISLNSTFSGGSAYTDGLYLNVPLTYVTSGTGTGATADVKVSNGTVISVVLTSPGTNYSVGDLLTVDNTYLGGSGSGFNTAVVPAAGIMAAGNSNSFLVTPTPYTSFEVASTGLVNLFFFSKNYAVSGVNLTLNQWQVTDGSGTLPSEISAGDVIYISSDTGAGGIANGKYTVTGTVTAAAGITTVPVVETIPVQATGDGTFHRPLTISEVPAWAAGTEVVFSGSTLPSPLVAGTTYYFEPTASVGFFNVATTRYPQTYNDYLHTTSPGTGTYTLQRAELYVPGAIVNVDNTYLGRNNGTYTVNRTVTEGSNIRIFTYEVVPYSATNDGYITLASPGFSAEKYCPPATASDLAVGAYFYEQLKFEFGINLNDSIQTSAVENGVQAPIVAVQRTTPTSSSSTSQPYTILPTGYDAQFFDVGGMDETLSTVTKIYGQ